MKSFVLLNRVILLLILFVLSIQVFAQSDYEIVQNFKQKFAQLEKSINSAKTFVELNSLVTNIDRFRADYIEHKKLLDNSLYPDNFEKAFNKLNLAFVIRNQDFTIIDILQIENLQLKEQIVVLNKRNTDLINKIQEYEYINKKDSQKIVELKRLVKNLKLSLRKRDEVIISLVDSLMPQLMKDQEQLSRAEGNLVYIEAEKNNLLANVKRSLQDNIRFIEVTALEPDDLKEIQEQQGRFLDFWKKAGTKLVDIYAEKKEKAKEIKEIDSLFVQWNYTLEQEAWMNIKGEFAYNDIHLLEFTNGEDFTNTLLSFIKDKIKTIGVKSSEESDKTYTLFADSTWFKVISPKWLPYLIDNKLLFAEQKRKIESKIADWKGRLTPASFDWIYVLVAVIAVAGLGYMNRRRLFKNK
ncbi:MAG: hypothetical protein O6940_02445 [Ignavibacteria bacterium]|nr:hypothetical protein [Ignavibacteria bacterium]